MTEEQETEGLEALKAQIALLRSTARALDENEGRVANGILLISFYQMLQILGKIEEKVNDLHATLPRHNEHQIIVS